MTALQILTADSPAPWSIEYHPERNLIKCIRDAKGLRVLERETYTGDGDQIYLDDNQIRALVQLINEESLP